MKGIEIKCESKVRYMEYKENKEKNLPLKKIKAGAVSVTIWNNTSLGNNGELEEYNTVSIERSYKDKKGEWQKTNSFRINDLPKAVVALQQAFQHLVLQDDQQVIIK